MTPSERQPKQSQQFCALFHFIFPLSPSPKAYMSCYILGRVSKDVNGL